MDQLPTTLRPARADDFERLLAIDRAAFPPALAYSRGELRAWMSGRGCRTWVAEEAEGEVVGFVVACAPRGASGFDWSEADAGWSAGGPARWPSRFGGRSPRSAGAFGVRAARRLPRAAGHLVTLDVAPGRQRRGVGSRLLAAAEEWLWSCEARAIVLETAAGEVGARGFYERQGYEAVALLPGYYAGRIDAWAMVKERR